MKTLYVGNIPFSSTEADLRKLFEQHGRVYSITLINNRETGRSQGFGFIEMDEECGKLALTSLNRYNFQGRLLRVNEARVKRPKPRIQSPSPFRMALSEG